ncbi:NADH:flavin oxidoreductase/NADH oxidase family protein [Paraperlucidibaca sp.]|jgi:2,4-dienoyl-CoA reductase-like NADH-dependent reductase (Old Yellow Enzyme family)|uniref:NADH:flavin oxidoreductase/NADH oxidase family protein n=1 Tax=Paraperlucidibaca sp. TaxID=2708021 RepID=UPI0039890D2E
MSLSLAVPLMLPNGATLPNRLAKSALSEAMGTMDNRVTQALVRLYQRWSAGGTGLLMTGNVMIDRRFLGEPGNVVIEDERDLPLLQEWAQAGRDYDTAIWVQLNHPGKQSPKGLNRENISPSAIPFKAEMQSFFATPREMTEAEILDTIARFANAAGIVKKAGFAGVQIHGAHGYLVSQFLSPRHNVREDGWGGTPEKRRRFVLELYAAMRAQVGADFPIGIKLNSADFQRGGFTEEESLATIKALADAGIDLIEISGGTYEAPAMTGAKASTIEREAYFLTFAETVREHISTPLMVTGGFRTLAVMQAALDSGALDLIGLGRPLAIEPDAANRLLAGEEMRYRVKPIKTGIGMIDRMAIMEVSWYTRQLHRMGNGKVPKPNESGLWSFAATVVANVRGTRKTRRMRAS